MFSSASVGSSPTRPVIVFEDFSITAMEAAKLSRFIESDSTENTWDFIVAGTRDSTGPLHTQTAEDRYEFYQTNRTNSQSVLFLDRSERGGLRQAVPRLLQVLRR